MDGAKQVEPHEGFVNTLDGKLHYLDWRGPDPQIHFLHANGFCAGTYSPFVKYLVSDFHIFASDIRGHGGSEQPNIERIRNWTVFARDLKTMIEQTMVPPVIGMGHSLGAVTTYIAAAKYPHLFSGIVLIDPVILPYRLLWQIAAVKMLGLSGKLPLARTARRRRRIFQGKKQALKLFTAGRGIFKKWSQEFVQAYLECGLLEKDSETAVLTCDPELEAQIFESVPVGVWRYAKKISCPVLAIRGELSDTFFAESAQRLKSRIADYELKTIANSGHFIPMEKPLECAEAIKDFLHRKLGSPGN
jgi:pimeloyl-ACP methyl ester carboxylesterase